MSKRKMFLDKTDTGLPPHDDAEVKEAVSQVLDLLTQHWATIKEFRDFSDNGVINVGVSLSFNHSAKLPMVRAKIRFARVGKDESEGVVEDPSQKKLKLEND